MNTQPDLNGNTAMTAADKTAAALSDAEFAPLYENYRVTFSVADWSANLDVDASVGAESVPMIKQRLEALHHAVLAMVAAEPDYYDDPTWKIVVEHSVTRLDDKNISDRQPGKERADSCRKWVGQWLPGIPSFADLMAECRGLLNAGQTTDWHI